jgi:hypothetical protein
MIFFTARSLGHLTKAGQLREDNFFSARRCAGKTLRRFGAAEVQIGENMETKVELDKIYMPSDEVVAREIEGEMILVPLAAGIGDLEDELYSLNETGKAVWKALDGRKSLREVADSLAERFDAGRREIEKDVAGLVEELVKRRMVVELKAAIKK